MSVVLRDTIPCSTVKSVETGLLPGCWGPQRPSPLISQYPMPHHREQPLGISSPYFLSHSPSAYPWGLPSCLLACTSLVQPKP